MPTAKMPHVEFNGTVSLGHIITAVSFVLSAGIAYGAIQSDLNEHRWRIQALERTTTELALSTQRASEALWQIKGDIRAIRDRIDNQKP